MAAFRTLWRALVSLYEETLVLVAGNVVSLALNVPLGLLLLLLGVPFTATGDEGGSQLLIVTIAWLVPFLPTPGNIALASLARIAVGPDVPRFADFRAGLRARWRLAIWCTLVSVVVLVALVANVYFYAVVSTGMVQFATIIWLYGTLFWLSLHMYLLPLLVHVAEPRLLDLYRRAALIALGHFGYTFLLLLILLAVCLVAVVFLPVYVLVASAYVSLVQAHALREIRRRHGDLVPEAEEEVSRL